MQKFPTFFLSHGGGPWPFMDEDYKKNYKKLETALRAIPEQLPEVPRAIIMVSGHWEEDVFTVQWNTTPNMVYDYFGFPDHTYRIQYPASGSPYLANKIISLLRDAHVYSAIDVKRGFDHGVFAPLAVAYPYADIPVVQLSLQRSYSPGLHIAVGRALSSLRNEGYLIIGSGLSFHNLRMFSPGAKLPSSAFDSWLQDALLKHRGIERSEILIDWEKAPFARICHPREDHFIPLMVAIGAAEEDEACCIHHEEDHYGGVVVSSFRFG